MEKYTQFKLELKELLDRYNASIVFHFNPPDMDMLKYCTGFKVYFRNSFDNYTIKQLTDKNSFSIDIYELEFKN